MNTAPVPPLSAETPRPLSSTTAVAGGNYSDEAIIASVERLIALRDLRDAKRGHKATAAILARLRDATRRAMA
jgi:hypothetical protein